MSGWIKLHRKIMDWEWYDEPIVRATMLHCLLRANYKDQSYKGEEIKRGSFPCGRDRLAKEIGISTQQLRTALTKLEKTGEINQRTTSKGTIITLCNYSSYQEEQPAINQHSNKPATNDQQTNNKQITTIERREEGKKGRREEEIYSHYPKKTGRAAALKSITKALTKVSFDELLETVKVYAEKTKWKEKTYIPNPATWFNQERWADDQSEWEQPKPSKPSINLHQAIL